MKKLISINSIFITESALFFEEIPINIGINLLKWIEEFGELEYSLETTDYNEKRGSFTFIKYPGLNISIYNDIIESINIYPYQYNSSPYFKGGIYIFGKKLEAPFKSDNIEDYFPNIEIKSKGYWKRFNPRDTIDYQLSDQLKIEITIGRDPDLVGILSITKIEN